MNKMSISAVGAIEIKNNKTRIVLEKPYATALKGLDGFSHINILWWCNDFDKPQCRQTLMTHVPYKNVASEMGIFATRSPQRPNPIALSVAQILDIDYDAGKILVSYVDANNMSPVIDLKPCTPCLDRVESPIIPQWCAHWPKSLEESAIFDWEEEFDQSCGE
jgi:Uncharacterized conserved protein